MRSLRRFFENRKNLLGILLASGFLFLAVAAPILSPVDEKDPGSYKRVGRGIDKVPHPPSPLAPLGTLPDQYDIYHSIVWGTRDALKFGLFVALGSSVIGIFFGAIAGYAGGHLNSWMMRFADAFMTFPPLAGVVFLQQMVDLTKVALSGAEFYNFLAFGGGVTRFVYETTTPLLDFLSKVDPLLMILILFSWMSYARLINATVLTLKQTEYVQAARALGGGPFWIIRKHLIPNAISPAIVLAARDVGNAVVIQATFSFIGLGGNSPWGTMLAVGRDWIIGLNGNLLTYWWTYLPATIMVVAFGISWNLIGDGINDALNPKSFTQVKNLWRARQKQDTTSGVDQSIEVAPRPQKTGLDPVLAFAREAMASEKIKNALHAYRHMIGHDRELDNVILDLVQFLRQTPGEAQFWQTLGDALARNGELENADHAYAQAQRIASRRSENTGSSG